MLAQHGARVLEAARLKFETGLERIENLGAAGVVDEAVDVGERCALAFQEGVDDRAQVVADQSRDVAREDDLQTILGYVPAHDVEAVGPCMLAERT